MGERVGVGGQTWFRFSPRAHAATPLEMSTPPLAQRGLPTIDEEGEREGGRERREAPRRGRRLLAPFFSTSTLPLPLSAVTAAGASTLPDASGITNLGGWTLETHAAPIAGEADLATLRARLAQHPAGPAPTLPEQTFAGSYVRATHVPTGLVLEFTAAGALEAWLGAGEAPLKVKEAAAWRASRAAEIQNHAAPTLSYDWTFTAPYGGDVKMSEGGAASSFAWTPSEKPLDRSILTARDPLLLWAEVPLLESELDDHGTSVTSVRLRAMPGAWFAVARCFVRVDGVAVRLVEARLLATWDRKEAGAGQPLRLTREVRHFAGSFEELRAAGAPGDGPAYADGDAASDALTAVAPVGVVRFETEELVV